MLSESPEPELSPFTTNFKYPPGSEFIVKLLLRDPDVVNMIVTAVVGSEARSLYSPTPTEWSNGTNSGVIYAASVTSTDLPPVLIEVEHTITADFIGRLLWSSLFVKEKFKAKPVVVVFAAHATRNEVISDFQPTSYPFMKQIPCKYWAEKCYILDHSTIVEGAAASPLPPMMAIAYFFSCQKLSLLPTSYQEDPTLQALYSIVKNQTGTAEQSATDVLREICVQTNVQFQNILNTLDPMPETLLKKRLRAYADNGAVYTQTCKRMYAGKCDTLVEPMPLPPVLSESATELLNQVTGTTIGLLPPNDVLMPTTDMEYVQGYRQTMKTMDWKLCFDSGKNDGFFSSYKSSASVKSAFYKKKSI